MPKDVEIEQKQRAHSAKGLQTILPERNRDSWERMQKNMGANVAIVIFAPTIPCLAQRNLL